MATQSPNPRVPLLSPLEQRGESLTSDARIVNGYVEKMPDGSAAVVKRPGLSALYTPTGTIGYGLYTLVAVSTVGTTLYSVARVGGVTNLYSNGALLGAIDDTGAGSYVPGYSFGSIPPATLFFHDANHAYSYVTGVGPITTLTNLNTLLSGSPLVPGCAYLDGTMYVGVYPNLIYGSGINDLTTWNSANVIKAQMRPDPIMYIFKQLNYVVALKLSCVEFFFDNANSAGSPLQSYPSAFIPYGCYNSGSVQLIEDCALWVTAGSSGTSVLLLQNLQPRLISTPAIERLLAQVDLTNTGSVYSWAFRLYGHRFYGLTLTGPGVTVVYDIDTNEWFQWTDYLGQAMGFFGCANTGTDQAVVQDHNTGNVYQFLGTNYADFTSQLFPVDIYTPNWDGGTRATKVLHRMDFLVDQAGTGQLQIQCSDDDYQTWSNYRQVDLSKKRPALYNCGTFRKRAWHIRYVANTALRLRHLELSILLGAG